MSYRDLTQDEIEAVTEYAARKGRKWKSELNLEWQYARSTGDLHSLRNTHGPSWLVGYKLPKVGV